MCAEDFSVDFRWYNSMDKRLVTFKNWTGPVNPLLLAVSGFYYMGRRDYCRCYCCGIEICHWEKEDDPRKHHFKSCVYANLIKDGFQDCKKDLIYFFIIITVLINVLCWLITLFLIIYTL